MPRAITLRGTVDAEGRPSKALATRARDALRLYADGDVELVIRKPLRSLEANNYLWGVCYPLIQAGWSEAGKAYPVDALHQYYAEKYLPPDFSVVINGETVVGRGRTSRLPSTEFYDFVEAIRTDETVLALGVVIPDPDPDYKRHRDGTFTIQNRLAA
jgi:hypothetical protein